MLSTPYLRSVHYEKLIKNKFKDLNLEYLKPFIEVEQLNNHNHNNKEAYIIYIEFQKRNNLQIKDIVEILNNIFYEVYSPDSKCTCYDFIGIIND